MNTKEEFAMKYERRICPHCDIEMEAWIEYIGKDKVRIWWQCEQCGYATEISVYPTYQDAEIQNVTLTEEEGK